VAPGEFKYSVQQGLKAACFAREDAASILLIQPAILRRLDALKRLAWVAIGLIAYIAYRLHNGTLRGEPRNKKLLFLHGSTFRPNFAQRLKATPMIGSQGPALNLHGSLCLTV